MALPDKVVTVAREIFSFEKESGNPSEVLWLIFIDGCLIWKTQSERMALDIARSLIGGQ